MRRRIAILAGLLACAPPVIARASERAERCVAESDRGQEQRDRGALVEARASFRACAADECPAMLRKDCAAWLEQVDQSIPTMVLAAKDARGNDLLGARAFVDGASHQEEYESGRAIALDPGPHVVRFEHPPDAPIELTVVLRMGERNREVIGQLAAPPPPPPPPPSPRSAPPLAVAALPPPRREPRRHVSPWAFVTGGVAIAAVGSFAYFGATGLDEKSTLRTTCAPRCTDDQVAPLRARYVAADVSLGIAVLALGATTWLLLHPTTDVSDAP
jgi:hypothetical protein